MNEYRLVNLLPFESEYQKNLVNNVIAKNLFLSLQAQGQETQNSIIKYQLDHILPLEKQLKDMELETSKYNLNSFLPTKLLNVLADTRLKNSSSALNSNLTTKAYYDAMGSSWTSKRIKQDYDFNIRMNPIKLNQAAANLFEQELTNDYYSNFGNKTPGNTNIWSLPSTFSFGASRLPFYKRNPYYREY